LGESVLRGFVVTLDLIQRIAPTFQAWTQKAHPTWADLYEASWYIQGELGISKDAYAQACVNFGRIGAVTVLATIAARHAKNEVASPGGLLRRMVSLYFEGSLRLDRTLFGLVDGDGMRRQ
jgi:replication initiation protein RepC